MLTLHHGGTSTASAKVRLALAEKGVAFESRLLDLRRGEQKDPAYLALNPAGVVPTLVHDGRAIVESSVILEYVEETWPTPPLMPREPDARAAVRLWLRRVDALHEACSILSSSVKLAAMRDEAAIAAMLARTPDPLKRARQQRLVTHGFDAPDIDDAIDAYGAFIATMETALAQAPWLSGRTFGLADCAALPYLHRVDVLGMPALWSRAPGVADWLARGSARPSFAEGVARWGQDQAYPASPELAAAATAHGGRSARA